MTYLQSKEWGWIPGVPRVSRRKFFDVVGYKPHVGQEQIHAACDLATTIVVPCGARFGKTLAAAHEMAFRAVQPRVDFMGWCVAPTHDLASLVFDAVAKILRTFYGHKNVRVAASEGVIEFTNMGGGRSRIMRRSTTGDQGARLVGFAVDFLVVDEASAIMDESIWESQLRTRLIDRKGASLHISSPRGTAGYFPKLFRASRDDQTIIGIQCPTWMNPYVDPIIIAQEKAKMPDRVFRQEYGAEFIAADGLVFDPEWLEQAAVGAYRGWEPGVRYVAACDVAISNDYTVLLIGRIDQDDRDRAHLTVVHAERFRRLAQPVQIERIGAALAKYEHPTCNFDATGLGDQFTQFIMAANIDARRITWNNAVKRDMVNNAVVLMERGAVTIPRRDLDPVFFDELSVYGWHETEANGYPTARAPQGAHDDYCSAFIMLCQWVRGAGVLGAGRSYSAGGKRTQPATNEADDAYRRATTEDRGVRIARPLGRLPDASNRRRLGTSLGFRVPGFRNFGR